MRRLLLALALLAAAAPAPAAAEPRPVAPAAVAPSVTVIARGDVPAPRREVWGYLPYWTATDTGTVVDFRVLTDLLPFSAGIGPDGAIERSSPGARYILSADAAALRSAARASGARTHLTLTAMGWGAGSAADQRALLGSPEARARLAAEAAALRAATGDDGVHLDIEPVTDPDGLVALVAALRAALGPGVPITLASMAAPSAIAALAPVIGAGADAIVIMGYDYRTGSSAAAGLTDPLDRDGTSSDLAGSTAAAVAALGAGRTILALPWYGRAWSVGDDGYHAMALGDAFPSSSSVTYAAAQPFFAAHGRIADPEGGLYTHYEISGCAVAAGCRRSLYLNGAEGFADRLAAADAAGLRGVGIWALGYDGDYPELRAALRSRFVAPRPPVISAVRAVVPGVTPQSVAEFLSPDPATITAAVLDAAGSVVATAEGIGNPGAWLVGADAAGAALPSGAYSVIAAAVGPNGDHSATSGVAFVVDRRLTALSAKASTAAARRVAVVLRFAAPVRATLTLRRANGTIAATVSARTYRAGATTVLIAATAARRLPRGAYTLEVEYQAALPVVVALPVRLP